jgi:hypothetical protein
MTPNAWRVVRLRLIAVASLCTDRIGDTILRRAEGVLAAGR